MTTIEHFLGSMGTYTYSELYMLVYHVINRSPDNSIRILTALKDIQFQSIGLVHSRLLDIDLWFTGYSENDEYIYVARNPITGSVDYRCPHMSGRDPYFFRDDGTNYEGLALTIVNTFIAIDKWFNIAHTENVEPCQFIVERIDHSSCVLTEMFKKIPEEEIISQQVGDSNIFEDLMNIFEYGYHPPGHYSGGVGDDCPPPVFPPGYECYSGIPVIRNYEDKTQRPVAAA
jgi:hypothetical protein